MTGSVSLCFRSLARMLVVALLFVALLPSDAFTVVPQNNNRRMVGGRKVTNPTQQRETTTQLYFFGGPKDDGSPGDYVCLVRHLR